MFNQRDIKTNTFKPPTFTSIAITDILLCTTIFVAVSSYAKSKSTTNNDLIFYINILLSCVSICLTAIVYYRYSIRRKLYNIHSKSDVFLMVACTTLTILATLVSANILVAGLPLGVISILIARNKAQNKINYYHILAIQQATPRAVQNLAQSSAEQQVLKNQNLLGVFLVLGIFFDLVCILITIDFFSHLQTNDPTGSAAGAAAFVYGLLLLYVIVPLASVTAIASCVQLRKCRRTSNTFRKDYRIIGITSIILNFIPLAIIVSGAIYICIQAI